jgi:hypothetical protein
MGRDRWVCRKPKNFMAFTGRSAGRRTRPIAWRDHLIVLYALPLQTAVIKSNYINNYESRKVIEKQRD